MRFLVDAHLPPALARRLEARGHIADDAIRDHAANVWAVIVTKDEDFAVRRLPSGGPAVVRLRLGNTRRMALLDRGEADLPAGRARSRRDAR